MLSKVLDMSKRTVTDIFLWSMLLSNSSVKQIRSNEIFCFHFAFDVWYCLSRLTSCEWAALSHTLERIDISEIGLVFADSSLSPDLRNGTISTYFLGSGKLLKEKELVIRLVMMGAIRGELSFRILAFTSSQPGALLDGKLVIILCTSPLVMDWNINKVVLFWLGLRLRFTWLRIPSVPRMLRLCSLARFVAFKAVTFPTLINFLFF